jgi:D-glycero-D-manno-heptose 1,7-bisphosphate phosphatase
LPPTSSLAENIRRRIVTNRGLQAAILVGGRGTRLGSLTAATPKPMLSVAGKPMLEHLIVALVDQGVEQVVLLAGYLGEQLEALVDQSARLGADIICRVESEPAGTGGALLQASDILRDDFLLLNGDSFFDVDIVDLIEAGRARTEAIGVLALRAMQDAGRYGSIVLEGERVVEFAEKRVGAGLINGGVYWLRRTVLDQIVNLPCSMEQEVFPVLARAGRLFARRYDSFFIDIGIPEDLRRAQHELPAARVRCQGVPR